MRRSSFPLKSYFIASALIVSGCTGQPQPPQTNAHYYARYVEPCGRSLLEIAETPEGPFVAVQPAGKNAPTRALRYHALRQGSFEIQGRYTETYSDDNHCGAYPEFWVESFAAWKEIKRCSGIGLMGDELRVYTEHLPTDRFAPEDFNDGKRLALVDTESCIQTNAECPDALRSVTGCDGHSYCCDITAPR